MTVTDHRLQPPLLLSLDLRGITSILVLLVLGVIFILVYMKTFFVGKHLVFSSLLLQRKDVLLGVHLQVVL